MTDNERFTQLWTRAQPTVSAYVSSLVADFQEADDIVQDVAMTLLRKLGEYDPSRPFVNWALGVARRTVMTSKRTHARSFLRYDTEMAALLADAHEQMAHELDTRAHALGQCLKKVGGKSRTMLKLRYEESLKPASIAAKLGITSGTVRVVLSRTRSALRECIERSFAASEGRA